MVNSKQVNTNTYTHVVDVKFRQLRIFRKLCICFTKQGKLHEANE